MTTLLFQDPLFLQHLTGPGHPERPERLTAILDVLARAPLAGAQLRTPAPATREELALAHTASFLAELEGVRGRAAQLDEDTATSPASVDAAVLAAGAAVQATRAVLRGEAANAFALVRPPGHHAEATHAMGFCLLNNAAIAAEVALKEGASRVAVLDWDVHHGNGTQHSFYGRRDVLYLSSHQFPFYPGTGAPTEIGTGEGAGYTVNCALPGGQGDGDYGAVFHELFLPVLQAYRPELILVSAGFDPHAADPLGGMRVTERGFAAMCAALRALAASACGGKLVLLLEGGYSLEGLSQSVHACVEVLTGRSDEFPGGAGPATQDAIAASRAALAPYWPVLA